MNEMTDEELRTVYQSVAVTRRLFHEGLDFRDGLRAVAREVARRAWDEFREATEAIVISQPPGSLEYRPDNRSDDDTGDDRYLANASRDHWVGFMAGVAEFRIRVREILAAKKETDRR